MNYVVALKGQAREVSIDSRKNKEAVTTFIGAEGSKNTTQMGIGIHWREPMIIGEKKYYSRKINHLPE